MLSANTVEIDYTPYSYQSEVHDSESRFICIVGGRRVGKSKMALQILMRHCIENPNSTAWWVAPTYSMAREVGWEEFLAYQEAYEPAIARVNDTLLRVRFKNGSVLYFKGGDNEKALRGRGLSYVVIDEAAFIDELVFSRALRPALSDRNGRALLLSTPNGRNWYYQLFMHAVEDSKWSAFHWPTHLNPLISRDELEEAAATISPIDFRQEFLAEFITRAGLVYDEFSQENLLAPGTPFVHDYEIYLGIDFGYANPSAVAFMAVAEGRVVLFDEIYTARTKMEDLENLIVKKLAEHHLEPRDVKCVYTDPAGNAEELSSGISPVDFLRMGRYGWTVRNRASQIAPGIALVRAFILNGVGERRFLVTKNCREALRSLSGYTYDKKDGSEVIREEPLKDGIHDHMCDAIRYFFVNRFDQVKYVAKHVNQFDYTETERSGKKFLKVCVSCNFRFLSHTSPDFPPFTCKGCTANG